MGLLSFLAPQTEERLHRSLAELVTEYHHLKADVERQGGQVSHVAHIHKRIDALNAAIRHAQTIPHHAQRMAVLHEYVEAEKRILAIQKRLAAELHATASRIIRQEKKAERAARELKAA